MNLSLSLVSVIVPRSTVARDGGGEGFPPPPPLPPVTSVLFKKLPSKGQRTSLVLLFMMNV